MQVKQPKSIGVFSLFILFMLVASAIIISSVPNSKNVLAGLFDTNDTAISQVNVTNDRPVVSDIQFYSNISTVDIDLHPGLTTPVFCNATINDANGYQDINASNATIYYISNSSSTPDNESWHYTNSSCLLSAGSGTTRYSSCSFDVQYFALNGTWVCNMTARDQELSGSFLTGNNASYTNISQLAALNVTNVIDFGQLSPGENSTSDFIANVTNLGNIKIDLNLHGYARTDGDNYAMVCEVGNISIGYEKYNLTTASLGYTAMTNLSGSIAGFTEPNFNLASAVTSSSPSIKNTYWKIGVPTGTRGQCNGTIVFNAVQG